MQRGFAFDSGMDLDDVPARKMQGGAYTEPGKLNMGYLSTTIRITMTDTGFPK
jgi:hypothetical protein